MHYEVELRELLYEADGTGGLAVTGSMWKPVRVFNKDTVPMVLTFEVLSAAQAYVGRNQAGAVRIVRVTEDGEREVIEAARWALRIVETECRAHSALPNSRRDR